MLILPHISDYLLVEEVPALINVSLPVVLGQGEELVPVDIVQTRQVDGA